MEKNVDISLYSRQLGVIDLNTMNKLNKMKVLIIGLRGLGIEIAKNIILAGPKEVAVFDSCSTKIEDLNSNFYLDIKDVYDNKRRDIAVINKLSELNSYVNCHILSNNSNKFKNKNEELIFILNNIIKFDLIIITEFLEKIIISEISEKCRELKKGFIFTCALGISGFVFDDFGETHLYKELELNNKYYPIKSIKKGNTTIITIEESSEGFPFLPKNSIVQLTQINGTTQLNNINLKVIKYEKPNVELEIDSNKFGEYINNGYLKQINTNLIMNHKKFNESFLMPNKNNKNNFNSYFLGRKDIVHSILLALYDENYKYKKTDIITDTILPSLNDEKEAKKLVEIAKKYFNNAKKNKENWINIDENDTEKTEDFDEKIGFNLSLFLKAEIPPICSFIGGVAAQEAVKYAGKFEPLNQWTWFEFSILVQELKNINREIKGSRYDEQIAIFGNELQNKLEELNLFLIGIGAAGSEYLKLFSLMGIGTKGQITVTDYDAIENSNLNRQFLYRKEDLGKLKSEISVEKIKKVNGDINYKVYNAKIGEENENLFDDVFWKRQNIVINGVDNNKARIYIDNKVTEHSLNLLDVGTLGTSASSGIYLNNASISYNEFNPVTHEDENNNIREVGLCTVHSFPNTIIQCIEWSRDQYEKNFVLDIKLFNDLLKLKDENKEEFIDNLIAENKLPRLLDEKLNDLSTFIDIYLNSDYKKIIEYSFHVYLKNFYYYINDLLKQYPPDKKNEDGSPFYSGSKKVPLPINNQNNLNELDLLFIKSYSNLLADAFHIKNKDFSDESIIQICKNIKIVTEEIQKEKINLKKMTEKIKIFLNDTQEKIKMNIVKLEEANETPFNKDNYSNSQYDFIYASSNLRAENFKIPKCDKVKSMSISGKIVPSIATTNAAITGLNALQIYLLLQFNEFNGKLNLFRDYNINIAINDFDYGYPPEKITHNEKEDIPKGWSIWDMIEIKGPLTIRDFINQILKDYNVKIESIFSGNFNFYNQNVIDEKILSKNIEEYYQEQSNIKFKENKKYIILSLNGTIDDNQCNMSKIKYIFK